MLLYSFHILIISLEFLLNVDIIFFFFFLFVILACPAAMFGNNCSQLCQCSGDHEQCHPVTGNCSCLPGYYGTSCELREYTFKTTLFLLEYWNAMLKVSLVLYGLAL